MTKPLISVVIASYNYAVFLPKAVDSVLGQTYDNVEIIVVNDGSTDDTDAVMMRYRSLPKVKYVKKENGGQASAKNCGIRAARGEYVAFLDADDYWMPRKLEKQMDLFPRMPRLGVVFSKAVWVDECERPIRIRSPKPYAGWVVNRLIVDNFVPFSSSLVKRECFEISGVFDEKLHMAIDWDLWLRLSLHYMFDFVDEPLFAYRVGHRQQMSHKTMERQGQSDVVMKRFMQDHPGLISSRTRRRAEAYTYRNRGDYYQTIDRRESLRYNIKSLLLDPFQPIIYLRVLKTVLWNSLPE